MLVLGLERDDVIISLFAGYNVICYLGSSSTFNFVLFLWGELCNRFHWLNVDFTHLTAYQGSETFSLPNWLLKEGLNGVQCLIRGYLPIIFSICWWIGQFFSFSDIFGKGGTSSLVFSNLRQSSRIFGSLQKSSEINCRKNDGRKLLDILNKVILALLEPLCFFLEKFQSFNEFFTVSVKMPKI